MGQIIPRVGHTNSGCFTSEYHSVIYYLIISDISVFCLNYEIEGQGQEVLVGKGQAQEVLVGKGQGQQVFG